MKLMALFYFVLSLLGVDVGASTFVHRTVTDGAEVLYSRATAQAGVARFECLRSASGQCHYTVLPADACTPASGSGGKHRCAAAPIERFTLAKGDSRQITGLHGFALCVSNHTATPDPDCKLPETMATR